MVNTISAVSLVSLLLPVAAVIILLSIFNGFGVMVGRLNEASESDLTIRLLRGKLFDMSSVDRERLRGVEGVEALSFVTEQTLMVERDSRAIVVMMRGVDGEYEQVVDVNSFVGVGSFAGDQEWVALSGSMPNQLGISYLGDAEVNLYSLKTGRLQSMIPTAAYSSHSSTVRGVIYVDAEHDQRYGYTSQGVVNNLLGRDSVATRVMVKVENGRAEQARAAIQQIVGDRFEVLTRSELNAALFEVVRYEKYGIMFIALLVMSLAAFTLMGAETMLIVERRRDIETLAMLGLSQHSLRAVFIAWGSIIGVIAIVGGVAVGVGVSLVQQHFEILMLPLSSSMAMA